MIWAEEILGIANQLTTYERPEPKSLAQDIVMAMVIAAAYLQPLWLAWAEQEETEYQRPKVIEQMERHMPHPEIPERHQREIPR